jgi:glucosamine-6-phosphate deaminase
MRPSERRTEHSSFDVRIFASAAEACDVAALRIARRVGSAQAEGRRFVLGLATGGSPIPVYRRLVEMHRAGELSLEGLITYNLDEYYPISPVDPNSYHSYMDEHLFRHVNIAPNRAHVLDGTVPEECVAEYCAAFDRWIVMDGGIDLQLLGLGRNGHIGFNEPSDLALEEALDLPTRRARLDAMTRADAARDFGGDLSRVPCEALTLGVKPILAAREILVLAFGSAKAESVAAAIKGPITPAHPASLLQTVAERVTWLIDRDAAAGLA